MDARLFDMLHDAGDHCFCPIADGVHVHLDGVFQKLVNENGVIGRGYDGLGHELTQGIGIIDDFHGAPPQDIGRADENGVADPLGGADRPGDVGGRVVIGLV